MSIFSKKPEEVVTDEELNQMVNDQLELRKEIVLRKKYCIEEATCVDDISPEAVVPLAKRIYDYIWPEQP